MKRPKRLQAGVLGAGLLVAASLVVLFAFDPLGDRQVRAEGSQDESLREGETFSADMDLPEWMDITLVDALTGEAFTIRDVVGRPILVESFAVWCSICLRQQKEMARLLELEGDRIVHIGLNTDPNEDQEQVRSHAVEHGLGWRFAVAPIEMTQRLIDAFGLTVINAPQAPVVLIAEDGSARLLPNGVKLAKDLLEETGLEPTVQESGREGRG